MWYLTLMGMHLGREADVTLSKRQAESSSHEWSRVDYWYVSAG